MDARPSLFTFTAYRYSRSVHFGIRESLRVSLSASPGDYAAFSITAGRLGFTLSAGRRVERERPNGSYKHTRFGIRCEIGWLNSV